MTDMREAAPACPWPYRSLPAPETGRGSGVAIIFFSVLGTMAIIGLLMFDMERKRRRLLGLLARVEKLGETGQAWRLRDQNMRRLGMSIFFNSQLPAGLDREVAVLEKEHDTSPPDSGKRYPIFAWKQMQSIEDRIQQLEGNCWLAMRRWRKRLMSRRHRAPNPAKRKRNRLRRNRGVT